MQGTVMTMTNTQTRQLKRLLEVVAGISDLTTFRFSPEGMRLQTMDGSHVCLIDVQLPESWFESYKCPADVMLETSLVLVVKMLGCIEHGQRAWLMHLREKKKDLETDGWALWLSGGDKETFDKDFKLPLFDLEEDLMDPPEVDTDTDIVLSCARWSKVIDELSCFGDVATFRCTDEATYVTASNQSKGTRMECKIGLDDVNEYGARDEEFSMSFPLNFLHTAAAVRQAAGLGPVQTVTVNITEGMPLITEYDLGNGASVKFYVAPRVDDNNDD